jgi:beta-galactosidase
MRIAADGHDLAMLTLSIVDKRGRVVPDAANPVTINLARGLRLLGTGNGDPNGTVPDHAATRPAFHGLMQAIVQSDGAAGPIRVEVSAPGLRGDTVSLLAIGQKKAIHG